LFGYKIGKYIDSTKLKDQSTKEKIKREIQVGMVEDGLLR